MTQPHADILSPPCLQHTWVSIRIKRNVILQSFNETEHTAHYSCYRIHIHGICCMKTSLLNSMHMTMWFSLIKFSGAHSVTFMCDNNWGKQHSCLTSKHSSKVKKRSCNGYDLCYLWICASMSHHWSPKYHVYNHFSNDVLIKHNHQ